MARYALGPPDEGGFPSLIDLDAESNPNVQLRLIDLEDVVGFNEVYKPPKKNAAIKDNQGKRKRRDSGYAETAQERAKERRREASRRYYMKYVAPFLHVVQLTYR